MKTAILLDTISAAADRTSGWYDLGDLTDFAVQVNFSGGAGNLAGTLTLEAAVDDAQSVAVTVSGSSQAVTSSADHVWNVTGAGYRWVRAKWVFTSGTGNMKVDLVAKEKRIVGA